MATFELAMTESSKLCARLEHVFLQIRTHIAQKGHAPRQLALESMIELLQVLDRPDVRTRLLYLVQGISEYFSAMPSSEAFRFDALNADFALDMHYLRSEPTRLGHALAHDALLKQLRAYITMHGRSAYHLSPLCHLWQDLDEGTVIACFQRWFEPMLPLEACVMRIMKLMRLYYQSTVYDVPLGFAKWDIPKSMQIFFVGVSVADTLLPTVSAGQQMVSVTFYQALWGQSQVMERYEAPVRFEWMICMLPIRRVS